MPRHADVSTTNTYYLKGASDDARAAVAKLESLVIGNETATAEANDPKTFGSDNEVATKTTVAQLS